MSKVLVFSDLHCHPHKKENERLEQCLKIIDWVFETAKERKIKNILFGGDLFHDRQKIDVFVYHKTFEVIHKNMSVKNAPNLYLLLGNHDLWCYEKTDFSSVYPLSSIKNVTVISNPSTLDIEGFKVSFLPYTHDPEKDLDTIKDADKRVLIGHVAIDGAIWNSKFNTKAEVSIENDGDVKKVTVDIFKGWQRVLLGHYHAEQQMCDNVEYIGSPLELSFGEEGQQKHIIELDLATLDREYIVNKFSPKHRYVKFDEIDKCDMGKDYIRITHDDLADPKIIEVRQKLEKTNIGSLEFVQHEKDIVEQIKNIDDAKSILKEANIVESYVEKADVGDLDKQRLVKLGQQIISKGVV